MYLAVVQVLLYNLGQAILCIFLAYSVVSHLIFWLCKALAAELSYRGCYPGLPCAGSWLHAVAYIDQWKRVAHSGEFGTFKGGGLFKA